MQRDLGQMFVLGNGGWLFDFGPLLNIRRSWYDDQPIIDEVERFVNLAERRRKLDMTSAAEIAAVYDAKSFFVTEHWKAEQPYSKGADCMDYFSHWFYAPGFVSPDKLDLQQMERLTGFKFKMIEQLGQMMIRCRCGNIRLYFGTKKKRFPRFAVVDDNIEPLGCWADRDEVAFAWQEVDGWNSVYVGAAPLPVEILRWLVQKSGAKLWSTRRDIVRATGDAAMIVATENGERSFHLPKPMKDIETGVVAKEHRLNLEMGEVRIFEEALS